MLTNFNIDLSNSSNFPLRPLWQGQGAAQYFIVDGVPSEAKSVSMVLTAPGASAVSILFSKISENKWGGWVDGYCVLSSGEGKYEILSTYPSLRTVWHGFGLFTVVATTAVTDTPSAPSGANVVTYVPDAVDPAKYHKLTVSIEEETGIYVPDVSTEVYIRDPNGNYVLENS